MSESQRLRALRDRLKLRSLPFDDRVRSILEITSTYTFTGSDLFHLRGYVARLKAGVPNPTPEQQATLAEVDARLGKRTEMIRSRAEKKKRGEPIYKKNPPAISPDSAVEDRKNLWQSLLEENKNGDHNSSDSPS